MSADGEPINNPEVIRRAEVDRVKGLMKQDNLIFRAHDVDNPGPNDLDGKERDLIRSFGLANVETVQQLFDSLKDPNRGHDAPKEKLDILATAVCESIIEQGRSEIVIGGSSSVEKQLLLTGFSGKDRENEDSPSFAFMVAEKFRERFSAGETRDTVTTTMEYLDYVKNSEYGKNGGLEETADRAYESLLQTKPNVLSKREMQARAAVLKYVSELKGNRPDVGVDSRTKREQASTEKTTSKSAGNSEGNKKENKRNNIYEVLDSLETETDVDFLTELARKNLDYIENLEDYSNRYRLTGQPTDVLDKISIRLSRLISESRKSGDSEAREKYNLLRIEIKARLAIFDIGKAMRESNFRIAEKGRGGMADAIEQCSKSNRLMDAEVLNFFFKQSKEVGIDIPAAWDLIQKANFDYESILREVWKSGLGRDLIRDKDVDRTLSDKEREDLFVEGKVFYGDEKNKKLKGGLFMDSTIWPQRAKLVEEYITNQLGENGDKAYKLAQELVDATGERSSFNFGFIKGDSQSEAIYFKEFRDDDASKGKDVGPMSNRGIKSLTQGWLRWMSNDSSGKYSLGREIGQIKAADVLTDQADIGKKDAAIFFGKQQASYVLTVKTALMDSNPDPKKILNLSMAQELVSSMNKVDPPFDIVVEPNGIARKAEKNDIGVSKIEKSRCGEQVIKIYYILGLLETFATKGNIDWDAKMTREFRRIFVDSILSDSGKSFISETNWKWCLEQKIAHTVVRGENKYLNFAQAMALKERARFVDGLFEAIGGSGGKGKR